MADTDQPTQFDAEEVKLRLDNLDKGVKEIQKQFSSIQTSLDNIYQDRDLLTDIINDISKVRSLVISADKHNENLSQDVAATVEKKTEEVKAEVSVTKEEIKETVPHKIVKGIVRSFEKEDATLQKMSFWKKLLFWKKGSKVKV